MRIPPPDRLTDGVVALRPPAESDAAPFFAAFRDDPGLGRSIGMESDPVDEAEVRGRIASAPALAERGVALELAIAEPDTDAFLGSLLLHSFAERDRRAEVGFWLTPGARGRGLSARAVSLAVSWAFAELGLRRVEMTTTSDNVAVDAIARRLGFTREGLMRSRAVERGVPVDVVMYGVLADEWRPLAPS